MFKILTKDKNSKARLGILRTPHGIIETPSYVFVGTYGNIRHLSPADIKKTKTQIFISNTFHLWKQVLQNKKKKYKKPADTFLTDSFKLKIPTMTDSGGFQVLSLAFGEKDKVSKFMTGDPNKDKISKRKKIKITNKGVHFDYMGKKLFLGPELSMKLQDKIGADIIFAFDHITSPLDSYSYNKKALKMTARWARICLIEHEKLNRKRSKNKLPKQLLFGIVQGGIFPDLREESARTIGAMPFDGFGIGGSYTQEQISKTLKWMIPHLPEEKPRHLLGVGKVPDIFEAVENGIDTFDCVIPTREARHGRLYTEKGHLEIRKGAYSKDKNPIDSKCGCPTCKSKISKSKIRELIKNPDKRLNALGQRYCLVHNIWFFNNLLAQIRNSIEKGRFFSLKYKVLTKFK